MAGSLKYGQATASLIVGKWSAASRQNTLAGALKEWGTLRRTIHAASTCRIRRTRRKIARQLNKGESLHALRRDLHYAQQGTVGKPLLADQPTSLVPDRADQLGDHVGDRVLPAGRAGPASQGRAVPDDLRAHFPAPLGEHQLLRRITVDVEAELAKLDAAGWRPLRPAALDLGTLLRDGHRPSPQWARASPATTSEGVRKGIHRPLDAPPHARQRRPQRRRDLRPVNATCLPWPRWPPLR